MATPKKTEKKDSEKLFIVIPANDLGEMEKGGFDCVEVVGSGMTAKDAVTDANSNFDGHSDAEDDDLVLVELHIVAARPLAIEKHIEDYNV